MTMNLNKKNRFKTRPKTIAYDELQPINEVIRQLSQATPDSSPCFIAKDKIAFMSHDNVILGYKVFESEEEKNLVEVKVGPKEIRNKLKKPKEVFNITQCYFPGSTNEISLDSLFMQGEFLIGENIMLMEIQPVPEREHLTQENVAPNYFNKFLLEEAYSNDADQEDAREMKFI